MRTFRKLWNFIRPRSMSQKPEQQQKTNIKKNNERNQMNDRTAITFHLTFSTETNKFCFAIYAYSTSLHVAIQFWTFWTNYKLFRWQKDSFIVLYTGFMEERWDINSGISFYRETLLPKKKERKKKKHTGVRWSD